MADQLVDMSSQFSGLPMKDLIGGPLQAACDAQTLLANASANFIKDIGLEAGSDGSYAARTVDFGFTRPKQLPDGSVTQEKVDLEVPLLAIVNTPSLSVKEAEVNFTMSVSSSTSSEQRGSLEAAPPSQPPHAATHSYAAPVADASGASGRLALSIPLGE